MERSLSSLDYEDKIMTKQNEPFYKSRRIWAASLTMLATVVLVMAPEHSAMIESIALIIASILGLGSWTMPKE